MLSNGQNGELATPYPENMVPAQIREYIKMMPKYGSCIKVEKAIPFEDIAILSRQTGTEFASITIGDKNYIIRGDALKTPLPNEIISKKRHFKLSFASIYKRY